MSFFISKVTDPICFTIVLAHVVVAKSNTVRVGRGMHQAQSSAPPTPAIIGSAGVRNESRKSRVFFFWSKTSSTMNNNFVACVNEAASANPNEP